MDGIDEMISLFCLDRTPVQIYLSKLLRRSAMIGRALEVQFGDSAKCSCSVPARDRTLQAPDKFFLNSVLV